MKPLQIENFLAGAVIAPYRAVKFDAADNTVIQADDEDEFIVGVANMLGAASGDARVDVITAGQVEIEFGGTVTRGGPVTADADGKAVAAAPATGANAYVLGFAMVSAVDGDIAPITLAPAIMQGA